MTWAPKPFNWRRRWGYRPPSLEAGPLSAGGLRRQADVYTTWLAQSRGWSIEEAAVYIEGQKMKAAFARLPNRPVTQTALFPEAA